LSDYQRHVPGMDGDTRTNVFFYTEAVQNHAKSEAAGRPIYDEVEMVQISFPGNRLTIVAKETTEEHKQRWPKHYAAFKAGSQDVFVEGTPLKAWTSLNRAQVAEFRALGIHTVDQLAQVDDYFCQRIGMGGHTWRQRARDFLAAAEDTAHVDKMSSDRIRLAEQVEAQNRQIAELGGIIENLRLQMDGLQTDRLNQPRTGMPDVGSLSAAGIARVPASPQGALDQPDQSYVAPARTRQGRKPAEAAA
jgi:hypothetical protein